MRKIRHTTDTWLFVEIEKPSQEQIDSYYKNTGELKSTTETAESPRIYKIATIKNTFDNVQYPVGSVWMMGDTPGIKVNFFGQQILKIQDRNLYARLD